MSYVTRLLFWLYLCRNVYQLKLDEIREVLGGVSRTAVGKVYKLALGDVENKRGCYKLMKSVEKL